MADDDIQEPEKTPPQDDSEPEQESLAAEAAESEESEEERIPAPEAKPLRSHLLTALTLLGAGIVLCSVAYTAVVHVVAHAAAGNSARGGLVEVNGKKVGVRLIGQQFTSDKYFHPRPSSRNYHASGSGSRNLGPHNEALTKRVKADLAELQKEGLDPDKVPVEMVTESGSSLDPHIPPEAALLQVPRVSEASGIPAEKLRKMIKEHTRGKLLGLFGQARVNVLLLNLDVQKGMKKPR